MAMETNSDRLMSDINVTPFVDVMLVLLIIFMVTAPMMMQGVDVALPEATAKPLDSQKENLVITVDKDQKVHINDFAVEPDYLREKLASILANRSDREVYLKADKEVPDGIVAKVMAEIKAAGVEKLGMVTIPAEEDARREPKK
ncbi:MAG: ExbD/TolR family protein [Desulfatitalea sp.]|nr:ExbD/TolR family protein [Desulfatitalea sp.]